MLIRPTSWKLKWQSSEYQAISKHRSCHCVDIERSHARTHTHTCQICIRNSRHTFHWLKWTEFGQAQRKKLMRIASTFAAPDAPSQFNPTWSGMSCVSNALSCSWTDTKCQTLLIFINNSLYERRRISSVALEIHATEWKLARRQKRARRHPPTHKRR